MKTPIASSRINSRARRTWKILAVSGVVLLLSVAGALGEWTTTSVSRTDADVIETSSNDNMRSLAMKIDVEENDVIDLQMSRGDVVVDSWEGSDVLVIVEKHSEQQESAVERSLNIKVTRHGNNVRIAALDQRGRPFADPNLSLRIVVPKRTLEASNVSSIYDLSKLTAVVFKALHREVLNWITR